MLKKWCDIKLIPLTVFLVPVFSALYYALQMPVSYDEAWTYLNFTKDPIAAATTYPAPNNHVLHSLVTYITSLIPALPELFKLRLSSLVVFFATLTLLYRFFQREFSLQLAVAVVSIASMLFMNIYYSYMSRGYGIVLFCIAVSLGCAYNIRQQIIIKKTWIILTIASIAGFYTMPSYLYFFVMLNLLLLYQTAFRVLLNFNIIVTATVIALYTPIILNSGIAAITDNPYVRPIGFTSTLRSLPAFTKQVLQETTGINWIIVGILCCAGLWKYYSEKSDKWLPVILICTPFLLLLVHGVIPFVRTFNYYGLIVVVLMLVPFRRELSTIAINNLVPILLLLQVLMLYNFHCNIYRYEDKDMAANITASRVVPKIIGNKKYLINDALVGTNLEFELATKKYNYVIQNTSKPALAAEDIRGFDYVIIKKEADISEAAPMISTKYYNVYKQH